MSWKGESPYLEGHCERLRPGQAELPGSDVANREVCWCSTHLKFLKKTFFI